MKYRPVHCMKEVKYNNILKNNTSTCIYIYRVNHENLTLQDGPNCLFWPKNVAHYHMTFCCNFPTLPLYLCPFVHGKLIIIYNHILAVPW